MTPAKNGTHQLHPCQKWHPSTTPLPKMAPINYTPAKNGTHQLHPCQKWHPSTTPLPKMAPITFLKIEYKDIVLYLYIG